MREYRLNQPSPPQPDPDAFDPAELIEDFEHPIRQFCMGAGMVRGENILLVRCNYCALGSSSKIVKNITH